MRNSLFHQPAVAKPGASSPPRRPALELRPLSTTAPHPIQINFQAEMYCTRPNAGGGRPASTSTSTSSSSARRASSVRPLPLLLARRIPAPLRASLRPFNAPLPRLGSPALLTVACRAGESTRPPHQRRLRKVVPALTADSFLSPKTFAFSNRRRQGQIVRRRPQAHRPAVGGGRGAPAERRRRCLGRIYERWRTTAATAAVVPGAAADRSDEPLERRQRLPVPTIGAP